VFDGEAACHDVIIPTRKIGKPWTGYHRRSLVETKMRCFKLLGERVIRSP